VLDRLATRPAIDVVARHLAGVRGGSPAAMAADYALDAVLERGADRYDGWAAIADYFDGAVIRLTGRSVTFDEVTTTGGGTVATRWTVDGGPAGQRRSGRDTFVVEAGRIVHQTVELDGDDF
jgi:hypothetical protein